MSERITEYHERIECLAQESYPQVALLKLVSAEKCINPCATARG
jgi:hypothetical protein